MPKATHAEFSRLKAIFWPVHRHEVRKLVPMLLMIFFVCFNYSILHNLKDSLVITGTSAGAEVIPFIKVWVMLPVAVLLTLIFTKLSNRYSQERVLYIMLSGFLIFYAFFTFVLYPARDALHPYAAADALEMILPAGFKGFIAMFRNWTFTSFYVMSELWAAMVLGVLFWGFANEVTRIAEAPRFYGIFGVGSNLAAVFAGQVANFFSQTEYNPNLPFGHDAWEQTLIGLVILVICSGCVAMGIFRWMNKNVFNDPSYEDLHKPSKERKGHHKLSVRESFSYLSQSKYLICIAVLVLGYNLSINLVEVVWKNQLRLVYSSSTDYNTFLNNLTSSIGIVSTLTALFIPMILRRFGWSFTAMLTPCILFVTGIGFFTLLIFRDHLSEAFVALTGTTPLVIAVFVGAIQNCLSRAAKYSVFDATTQMAFIPLSHECKLKGKAAIDGVGSRLGKSGGSIIHQGLLMIFATLSACTPYIGAILLVVIVIWMVAVRSLGKQFNAAVEEKSKAPASEPQELQPQADATPGLIQEAQPSPAS